MRSGWRTFRNILPNPEDGMTSIPNSLNWFTEYNPWRQHPSSCSSWMARWIYESHLPVTDTDNQCRKKNRHFSAFDWISSSGGTPALRRCLPRCGGRGGSSHPLPFRRSPTGREGVWDTAFLISSSKTENPLYLQNATKNPWTVLSLYFCTEIVISIAWTLVTSSKRDFA
jgi:hypothetical protein